MTEVGCRHQLITTQLSFKGDDHAADDIASAVKPEMILDPSRAPTPRATRSPATSSSTRPEARVEGRRTP
ncbi:hypothetical protein [Knoellia sp. p5-6-4]|uniref:dioxygenase family protein n=1 Tax=unclassified Knoellia TaxID=2618719 RepID=UPI0031F45994